MSYKMLYFKQEEAVTSDSTLIFVNAFVMAKKAPSQAPSSVEAEPEKPSQPEVPEAFKPILNRKDIAPRVQKVGEQMEELQKKDSRVPQLNITPELIDKALLIQKNYKNDPEKYMTKLSVECVLDLDNRYGHVFHNLDPALTDAIISARYREVEGFLQGQPAVEIAKDEHMVQAYAEHSRQIGFNEVRMNLENEFDPSEAEFPEGVLATIKEKLAGSMDNTVVAQYAQYYGMESKNFDEVRARAIDEFINIELGRLRMQHGVGRASATRESAQSATSPRIVEVQRELTAKQAQMTAMEKEDAELIKKIEEQDKRIVDSMTASYLGAFWNSISGKSSRMQHERDAMKERREELKFQMQALEAELMSLRKGVRPEPGEVGLEGHRELESSDIIEAAPLTEAEYERMVREVRFDENQLARMRASGMSAESYSMEDTYGEMAEQNESFGETIERTQQLDSKRQRTEMSEAIEQELGYMRGIKENFEELESIDNLYNVEGFRAGRARLESVADRVLSTVDLGEIISDEAPEELLSQLQGTAREYKKTAAEFEKALRTYEQYAATRQELMGQVDEYVALLERTEDVENLDLFQQELLNFSIDIREHRGDVTEKLAELRELALKLQPLSIELSANARLIASVPDELVVTSIESNTPVAERRAKAEELSKYYGEYLRQYDVTNWVA